ncbi:MAG: NFACT RNA binding domain-containing protein, partial [Anaerolineae bacterium]
ANAEAYFDRHRRAKRARRGLPARLARSEAARAHLQQLAADLALAEDRGAIDAVAGMLASSGLTGRTPHKVRAGVDKGPRRLVTHDGFVVWVGANSRQNDTVTFSRGARGDLWLHVLGAPGSHVVIKAAGRPVPQEVQLAAAAVAAWYSKARGSTRVDVAVTDVGRVKRAPGGFPGLVSYSHASTLSVRPAPPDEAFARIDS